MMLCPPSSTVSATRPKAKADSQRERLKIMLTSARLPAITMAQNMICRITPTS